MNKELEALKRVKNFLGYNYCSVDLPNELKLIEQALQRLEAIENSKSSEALIELKRIICNISYLLRDCDINEEVSMNFNSIMEHKSCDIIKQALIKSQEQEKVLEIIFEKGLSLTERDIIKQSENYEQYQIKISWWNYKPFAIPKSKEEFDLLKRY